jgi:hypothetical protein
MHTQFIRRLWLGAILLLAPAWALAQTTVEDFEFASSTANAQAGVTVTPNGAGNAGTADSATGADATEGSYALKVNYSFGTEDYNDVRVIRTLASPLTLAQPLTAAELAATSVQIDVKGDAGLGDKTLYVFLVDSDGEKYRYIAFNDTALDSATYTADHTIAFYDADPWDGVETDNKLTAIASVEILLQDNTTGTSASAESGTAYFDNLRFKGLVSEYRTITIDGDMSDWDGVPVAATDATGDGGSGRDMTAIYLANDTIISTCASKAPTPTPSMVRNSRVRRRQQQRHGL